MADRARSIRRNSNSDTLADILERVLETGIVIAGDIRVNLNDVELLTIQIRLIVCSVDKAEEMGMDWWKRASYLTSGAPSADRSIDDNDSRTTADVLASLDRRLERLEKRIETGSGSAEANDAADDN
ncbi:MAG: gas vesicle protein [Bacteroidetes bacterium]|jgi:hypothetical protein|nr:gas vesicle protein [Bacteroidota bacterium]